MLKYLGGKALLCKDIAHVLKQYREPNQLYIEPFVGGAWVLSQMDGPRLASDINRYLIAFYEAVSRGWLPPREVSESMYRAVKKSPHLYPKEVVAFVGIACSYGGKWFGGYARHEDRNFALNTLNTVRKKKKLLEGVHFLNASYDRLFPQGALIYCDPPYQDTTSYAASGKFSHDKFWKVVRKWSERNTVIVSEYDAPRDFICLASFEVLTNLGTVKGTEKRLECLFKLSE